MEVKRLEGKEKKEYIDAFLVQTGDRLRIKREKCNLTQSELAWFVDVGASTIGSYECGTKPMPLSCLPLVSLYCDFPISDLFPEDKMKEFLSHYRKAVKVQAEGRYRRGKEFPGEGRRTLQARIYEVDGKEIREEVTHKEKSKRQMYRDAEMPVQAEPFTDDEFCTYVVKQDLTMVDSVIDGCRFLDRITDMKRKDTLKGSVADYIIDTTIVNGMMEKYVSTFAKKAYAYYKQLMDSFLEGGINHQDLKA